MKIIQAMQENARQNLKGNLHKVAAVMARKDGLPIARDEVTIKEAAYLVGVGFFKNLLEKKAMFSGILSARQALRK
jgi:hypothetical protein